MIFDKYVRLCGYKQGGNGSNQYVQHAKMVPLLNYLLKKSHLSLTGELQGALNLTDSMKEV